MDVSCDLISISIPLAIATPIPIPVPRSRRNWTTLRCRPKLHLPGVAVYSDRVRNHPFSESGKLLESHPLIMTAKPHNYDEDKIKTLSSLEHIRKRSGMYIGRVGDGSDYDDGIYILLKEVVDNAVDEFIMGFARRI